MNGAEVIVSALENEGVEQIFGIPGEENLDVVEALRKSSIELVLTRHEQAAAFMAATHGRLTGRAGVCLATLGPGALNLTTGAAYALLGAMPMVMITGQKGILSRKQARFQVVDIVSTMTPLTKMARQIVSPATIPSLVREAFRVAQQERPGPVHLELPGGHRPRAGAGHGSGPAASDRLADRAARGARPGRAAHPRRRAAADHAGRRRKPAAPRRRAVGVRATGADPVLQYPDGQGRGRPAGQGSTWAPRRCRSATMSIGAIDRADLIISIGHDTVEKPPFFMGPDGPTVLHVGYLPATVEEVFFPQAELIGDVGPSLALLADRLEGKLPRAPAPARPARRRSWRISPTGPEESRYPLTPQRIVHDVREAMPEDGIVCLDNGMYKIWFARNYRTHVANTLLLDNALATMGAGCPRRSWRRCLNPGRRVLAVCGDGGFMMNSQEMETAVRLKLNLVVLVLQDHAYGMIRWKQATDGFPDFGMTFGDPDFVAYAGGLWREGEPGRNRRRPRACARSRVRGRAACISS